MKTNDVSDDRESVTPPEVGLRLSFKCAQMALTLYSVHCVSFGSISKVVLVVLTKSWDIFLAIDL